jgi:asparagine synthase (glutamine-hydrolysing)
MLVRPGSTLSLYLLRRELFLPSERRLLHDLPSRSHPETGIPADVFEELIARSSALDIINQVSFFEMSGYMQHMLLRDVDVFSMAHGLEVRVPLLDHRLVERVVSLPGHWKMSGPTPKALLTKAVGRRLPANVCSAPKKGFTLPWDAWLRGPLHNRVAQAVGNASLWSRLGIAPTAPPSLWQRFLRRDQRVAALQVLSLVILEDYASRHGIEVA